MIQQVKHTRYLCLTMIIFKTNSFLIHTTIILFSRDYNKLSSIAYIRETYPIFEEKMKDAEATTQSRCLVLLSSNCSNNNRKSLCLDAFFQVHIPCYHSIKCNMEFIDNNNNKRVQKIHFVQKVRKTYLIHKTMLWS